MTKVLIVEDQRMARENIEKIVCGSGRYELVGSISSADLALSMCEQHKVELVLMDVCTAGRKDGIEASADIKKKFPQIKIIIVTSMPEFGYLDRAHKAGADSFWYKEISKEDLIDIMDRTVDGEHVYPIETPVVKLGLTTSADLTNGEIRVLRQIMEGLEYDEIAKILNISRSTVNYHVSNILSKTGYTNKTLLAIAVAKKQLIIPALDTYEK